MMRNVRSACWIVLFVIAIAHAQEPLTNESIVKLVKAGLSEDMIVSMVSTQPAKYSLNTDDIVALKTAGVSEKIIVAMVTKSAAVSPAAAPAPAAAILGGAHLVRVHDVAQMRAAASVADAIARAGAAEE